MCDSGILGENRMKRADGVRKKKKKKKKERTKERKGFVLFCFGCVLWTVGIGEKVRK